MLFKRIGRKPPSGTVAHDTCFLIDNDWDDFGFKTTFGAVLFDAAGARHELGFLKILKLGMKGGRTQIADAFDALPHDCCSLGNDREYYVNLTHVDASTRKAFLKSIRDCAADNNIWKRFRSEDGMNASLLRGASRSDVLEHYPSILLGHTKLTSYSFSFDFSTRDGESERCEFLVSPLSRPPSNIHVLIGRNGVGKTRLLAGMADALTENKAASIGLSGRFAFSKGIDPEAEFLNLVVVSFSAFDRFDPIHRGSARTARGIPYYYIGIKADSKGSDAATAPRPASAAIKSPDDINNEFSETIRAVLDDPSRASRWLEAMDILSSDPGIAEIESRTAMSAGPSTACEHFASQFSEMSSGHKVVLLIITKLVELVSDRSLVLIDEPETHLHPPLLGSFVRALSNLLVSRNGAAIVATHSPVVLQEVPASCVSVLMRAGRNMRVIRPDIETFAENVSVLTRKVFGLEVEKSGFYKLLSDSADQGDYDDVMRLFRNRIGSEGRALTRAFTAGNE